MANDIFVRNCRTPDRTTSQSWGEVWDLREMLLVGGYTENSNDGDAAWTGSALVSAPVDCAVDAGNPRQITSPSGPFTQAMVDDNHIIGLLASNDQNRILARIEEYVDANTIKIDRMSWNDVVGWATEFGITARVSRCQNQFLSSGAWVLMDAPGGSNMQVRIVAVNSQYYNIYVRPNGQGADPTETTAVTIYGWYAWENSYNMAVKDQHLLFWKMYNYNGTRYGRVFGFCDLDLATGDPNPGLLCDILISTTLPWHGSYYMLDTVPAAVTVYPSVLKQYGGQDTDYSLLSRLGHRLVNGQPGYVQLHSPWVYGASLTNEAYRRGRIPEDMLRFTYQNYDILQPVTDDWLHLYNGLAVPRRPGDPVVHSPI